MAKTFEQLTEQANQIKNETAQGANTAQRIGQMHLDTVEKMKELGSSDITVENVKSTTEVTI